MSRAHRTLLIATVAAASLVITTPQAHAASTGDQKPITDIRYHNNYGGPDCIFTFWGVSDDIGQETTITAEPYWHLILTTHWDDQTHDLGEHSQTYTSEGWWIDATSAVNIIEGATLTITPTNPNNHPGNDD